MQANQQKTTDLFTYTKEILDENFIFCPVLQQSDFPLRISLVNANKSQKTIDLFTFTKEILNEKLHFLCSITAV